MQKLDSCKKLALKVEIPWLAFVSYAAKQIWLTSLLQKLKLGTAAVITVLPRSDISYEKAWQLNRANVRYWYGLVKGIYKICYWWISSYWIWICIGDFILVLVSLVAQVLIYYLYWIWMYIGCEICIGCEMCIGYLLYWIWICNV